MYFVFAISIAFYALLSEALICDFMQLIQGILT